MRVVLIFISLLVCFNFTLAKTKKYDIKSGIVEYDISGNGEVMGMSTTIQGSSKLIFKSYGSVELSEEKSTQNIMGQNELNHNIVKIDNGTAFIVDFEDRVIYKKDITKLKDKMLMQNTQDKYLKNLGAKQTGTSKVLGYTCKVWQMQNAKICVYKAVPLRVETSVMGINQIQEAKKIDFNISIKESQLALPKFPIKNQKDVMIDMQEHMKDMSPEQMKIMQDMMKNMPGMSN